MRLHDMQAGGNWVDRRLCPRARQCKHCEQSRLTMQCEPALASAPRSVHSSAVDKGAACAPESSSGNSPTASNSAAASGSAPAPMHGAMLPTGPPVSVGRVA